MSNDEILCTMCDAVVSHGATIPFVIGHAEDGTPITTPVCQTCFLKPQKLGKIL